MVALKDIYLEVQNSAHRVSKGLFLWGTFILLRARPGIIIFKTVGSILIVKFQVSFLEIQLACSKYSYST